MIDVPGFWERRAVRRLEYRRFLIEQGLDCRTLARGTIHAAEPKLFVAFAIIGLFGWAFARNPTDQVMLGALIAAFAGAWGYYLGNSNSATRANDRADEGLALAREAVRQLPASSAAADAANDVAGAAADRAEEIADPAATPPSAD